MSNIPVRKENQGPQERPAPPPTDLGVSPLQYDYLKARLATSSEVAACRQIGVTKNVLRHWKRSSAFHTLLEMCRRDKPGAFRALALHLTPSALDALERLLRSDKSSDVKAGLESFLAILRIGAEGRREKRGETPGEETDWVAKYVFNILQLRGQEADAVVQALRGEKVAPLLLEAP